MCIRTGYAGVTHEEYEDLPEDWDEMDATQRKEYLDEAAIEFLEERIEYGATVVD